jgi:hypothetical protein
MKPKDFDAQKISGIYVSILRTRFSSQSMEFSKLLVYDALIKCRWTRDWF